MPDSNPFELLGLPEDASPAEIRRAYLNIAKTAHPDAQGDGFTQLNAAYKAATEKAKGARCGNCGGSGVTVEVRGFATMKKKCEICGGSGKMHMS